MNPSTKAYDSTSALQNAALPETHRAVLQRIAAQRERLHARRSARAQALALRHQQSASMPTGGPLPERLLAFARLHPVALAAAVSAALLLGPRRLIRWSGIVLPLLVKLRR